MAENTLPAPESLSYEAARDELIAIVKTLESGQAPLEDTLAMWERGKPLPPAAARFWTQQPNGWNREQKINSPSPRTPEIG